VFGLELTDYVYYTAAVIVASVDYSFCCCSEQVPLANTHDDMLL